MQQGHTNLTGTDEGVADISSYVGENNHILLTTNTVSFSLAYLQLTD